MKLILVVPDAQIQVLIDLIRSSRVDGWIARPLETKQPSEADLEIAAQALVAQQWRRRLSPELTREKLMETVSADLAKMLLLLQEPELVNDELLKCLEGALLSVRWRVDLYAPGGFNYDPEAHAALCKLAVRCEDTIAKAKAVLA